MKSPLVVAALALALLPLSHPALRAESVPAAAETPAQRDARMAWWREARFGMFIHWGLYALPAGNWNGKPVPNGGEWIMNSADIPVADYKALAPQFNPVKFDADAWVALAKSAGMRYIVITAKHHDGFALWPSKASPFNISATPFQRDPLRELADACRKNGLKLGFYYSQVQDWTHPGGHAWPVNGRKDDNEQWDPAQKGSFDDYIDNIAVPQVRELLTDYGKDIPAVLWWDTPRRWINPEQAGRINAVVQELRPDLIMNNRLGGGVQGDTETPEQHIPPQGYPGKDWETCMTMNDTWGFKTSDNNWKPTEKLIHNLCDIASKGGNYLLNVGPDALGQIPAPSIEHLTQIGTWMNVNGEAIHGTGPTPFGPEAGAFSPTEKDKNGKPKFIDAWEWRATTKPGKIYLHIFKWPADGKFVLNGLLSQVTAATLLSAESSPPLPFQQKDGQLLLTLPPAAPDPIASVIRLDIADTTPKVSLEKTTIEQAPSDTGAPVVPIK